MTKLDSIDIKKRIVMTAVLLIMFTAAVFLFTPIAHGSITTWILNMLLAPVKGLSKIIGSHGAQVYAIATSNSAFSEVQAGGGVIGKMMVVTCSVSASLYFIYLFVFILREAADKGELTSDFLIKTALRSTVVLLLLVYSPTILRRLESGILIFLDRLCEALALSDNPLTAAVDNFVSQYDGMTLIEKIALFGSVIKNGILLLLAEGFIMVISSILSIFIYIGTLFVSYRLIIELTIRKIFFPVAIVGSMADSGRAPAINYIKKYFTTYLRIAVFMISFTAIDNIAMQTLADAFSLPTSLGTPAALGAVDALGTLFNPNAAGGAGGMLALLEAAFLFPLEYTVLVVVGFTAGAKGMMVVDEAMGYGST